ncbi:MAG: hypothetical protein ABIK28_14115, partial [Planctomycetota bacterium]
LYAYTKYRQAKQEVNHETRKKLISDSDDLTESLGIFNPIGAGTLFWREDMDDVLRNGLRINLRHGMVDLYKGVALFSPLYKGGKLKVFEETYFLLKKSMDAGYCKRIAAASLGRTCFFWARTFWDNRILEEAESYSNRALEASGTTPREMIFTTLGQIALLRDDLDDAKKMFEMALKWTDTTELIYHFNSLCGLGKTWLYRGDMEKALKFLGQAFDCNDNDPYVNMTLAEYYFLLGKLDRAQEYAERALRPLPGAETNMASCYLMLARILVAKGEEEEAIDTLALLDRQEVIHSPKDLCIACILITTIAKVEHRRGLDVNRKIKYLVESMLQRAHIDASNLHIYRTMLSAYSYLTKNHKMVCELLDESGQKWVEQDAPDNSRSFKMKRAYELYLLAMAWHERIEKEPDLHDRSSPRVIFQKAEEIYCGQTTSSKFMDYWDIYERIRKKAKTQLGL